MPRYAITANFTPTEIEKIDKACKAKGCSKYRLLREGTIALSEAILDGEKEFERGKRKNIQELDEGRNKGREEDVFDL